MNDRLTSAERGIITTEHTIWCHCVRLAAPKPAPAFMARGGGEDTCHSYYQTSEPRAAADARHMGWLKTWHLGWVCPACAVHYRQQKETA